MTWPYRLDVSLDEEQQAHRRRLLDAYGQFAQLSVLLLPLFYQLSLAIRLIAGRVLATKRPDIVKDHQSPVVSTPRKPDATSTTATWERLRWVSEGEVMKGWGPWQQWLLAQLWASWLLVLVVKDTENGMSFSYCFPCLKSRFLCSLALLSCYIPLRAKSLLVCQRPVTDAAQQTISMLLDALASSLHPNFRSTISLQ